jgi:hypothetical protein
VVQLVRADMLKKKEKEKEKEKKDKECQGK